MFKYDTEEVSDLSCLLCLPAERTTWAGWGSHPRTCHATARPDSDKQGVVEGRRGYQLRQTFLAFVRDMNQ